jgi:hypothetical protein
MIKNQDVSTHPAAISPDSDQENAQSEGVELIWYQGGVRGVGVELGENHEGLLSDNLDVAGMAMQTRAESLRGLHDECFSTYLYPQLC